MASRRASASPTPESRADPTSALVRPVRPARGTPARRRAGGLVACSREDLGDHNEPDRGPSLGNRRCLHRSAAVSRREVARSARASFSSPLSGGRPLLQILLDKQRCQRGGEQTEQADAQDHHPRSDGSPDRRDRESVSIAHRGDRRHGRCRCRIRVDNPGQPDARLPRLRFVTGPSTAWTVCRLRGAQSPDREGLVAQARGTALGDHLQLSEASRLRHSALYRSGRHVRSSACSIVNIAAPARVETPIFV
jgi:hypothetical protein